MKEHQYINKLTLKNRVSRFGWGVARLLFFRSTPRWGLHGWRRSVLRAFGAKVGAGCRIDPSARIWLPSNLEMGELVAIGAEADIYCVDRITLGSKVSISQRAFLCTASHDISTLTRPLTHAPIKIENHAWVAAEAMLFPGAVVREGAVIGARAVFRGEADPWSIWVGNPSRQVGFRKLAIKAETPN